MVFRETSCVEIIILIPVSFSPTSWLYETYISSRQWTDVPTTTAKWSDRRTHIFHWTLNTNETERITRWIEISCTDFTLVHIAGVDDGRWTVDGGDGRLELVLAVESSTAANAALAAQKNIFQSQVFKWVIKPVNKVIKSLFEQVAEAVPTAAVAIFLLFSTLYLFLVLFFGFIRSVRRARIRADAQCSRHRRWECVRLLFFCNTSIRWKIVKLN